VVGDTAPLIDFDIVHQFIWGLGWRSDKDTALLVGRSRDRPSAVSLGTFSEATNGTMCRGVDSASKNEYQDTPRGKGGRCLRVTTLPHSQCRKSRRSRSLNLLAAQEPLQACSGKPLPFYINLFTTECIVIGYIITFKN
jgi:hypothetical protein